MSTQSHDSSVGIALSYGLDNWGSRVQFPLGAGNFCLHHHVQNGSGAHPASCLVGTRGSFPGGKAAGTWSWPLPSTAEVKEWVELYLHSPNMLSWHGAQLKHRDNFTFTFIYVNISLTVQSSISSYMSEEFDFSHPYIILISSSQCPYLTS
jgi:hypothetical protein